MVNPPTARLPLTAKVVGLVPATKFSGLGEGNEAGMRLKLLLTVSVLPPRVIAPPAMALVLETVAWSIVEIKRAADSVRGESI